MATPSWFEGGNVAIPVVQGTANGQVPVWNGTSWVPGTGSVLQGATVATVSSVTSPYTVLTSDALISFDESNGSLATALLPAIPVIGERHTFKWWAWTLSSPPPIVSGNGKQIEAYTNPVGVTGLVLATTITTQGGQATWQYDGTQWVLVG